jgi:hypothetical protein
MHTEKSPQRHSGERQNSVRNFAPKALNSPVSRDEQTGFQLALE